MEDKVSVEYDLDKIANFGMQQVILGMQKEELLQ